MPILEIGNLGGGGLEMLAEYFRESRVIGFDPLRVPEIGRHKERITHYSIDAYNDSAVKEAEKHGLFSVIIDDGPHTIESQKFFAGHYTKLLAVNGIAIIEDVQRPEDIETLKSEAPVGISCEHFDLRNVNGRYDDILVVFKR